MPIKRNKVLAKHEQVEGLLMERIANGEARTGAALPSESRLMRDLKVSRTTVRRAIGNLVRQGVLDSRAGFGHVVRSQASRPVIGLPYGQALLGEAPFFGLQLAALQAELERRSFSVRLYAVHMQARESSGDRERLLRDARRGILAGVLGLAWPSGPRDEPEARRGDAELMRQFKKWRVPCTAIAGHDFPAAVGFDYESVGFLGATHFLDRGVRDVSLMTMADAAMTAQVRTVEGYRRALKGQGVAFHADRVLRVWPGSERDGYRTFKAWWPRAGSVRALIIDDDLLAKGAMIAALALGVQIPDRLALAHVSIQGSPMFFPCHATRLELDPGVLARQAVNRLLELIATPGAVPAPVMLKPAVLNALAPDNARAKRAASTR